MKNGNLVVAAGSGDKPFFQIGKTAEPVNTPPVQPEPTDAPAPPVDSTPALPAKRSVAMKAAAAALRHFLDVLTDPHSAIAAVDKLGISRGTLVIEEEGSADRTVYKNFDLAFDKAHGVTTFSVSAEGPSRRWSIAAMASGTPGVERRFNIKIADLSLDELQFATGTRFSAIERATCRSPRPSTSG